MVKWFRQNSLYLLLIGCILVVGFGAWVLGEFSKDSPAPVADIPDVPQSSPEEIVEVTAPPAEAVVEPVAVAMPPIVEQPTVKAEEPQAVPYELPLKGDILREYATDRLLYSETMGDWRTHSGVDFAADVGTPVAAVADGTVLEVFYDKLQGITVSVQHPDGNLSHYANLASLESVQKGQTVSQGEIIGTVGETASFEMSDPPHLHFELEVADKRINPMEKLPTLP